MKLTYLSKGLEDTYGFGYRLSNALSKGDIVCLTGQLGAGKTSMVKGIAKGLGVEEDVTSPTFTIVNEYYGRLPLYHFDVYRISMPEEMYEIGFEEYIYGEGVCVIEWADLIKDIIPQGSIWIDIRYLEEDERTIEIVAPEEKLAYIIEEMDR
ncbi:tRNA (adenosine(37)-N6)-threonylcarbamoyltransferase complex ATPase subunit type 1 TsaE [Caldanaerobius polysaccharolyticus]|uniref:tRNA (adenosine(37)-N6)-threonylcarbamoyltransferase complex ATPase subunit type 1 TsaE n=1 Tax=Caldanaerobius polysaccharolyticus TaxID=44256 RepID=UPI000478934A|nr:tRNA (adenosine(37)-N6)-threonylcarbamoyltransferase complex ATPase subunit type 1 TsaE [Caldanaerobius polysaccharolyticus]